MAHRHFGVLVKCVKASGVSLIERKEDGRSGHEFVHRIATAVREKSALILGSVDFFSILSDGSQARKTKAEKELVLIRMERNGTPVYIIASLLEIEKFGGGNANAIVKGINSLFSESGSYRMSQEDYQGKLVSSTADGASVNTGKYNGVLTQLKRNRPWLLTIHCANHRVELAVKSAFYIPEFEAVEEFYKTNYYLLKNSGKLKSLLKECAASLGIHYYELPKIHGTRFVNHRRRGFKNLLETWPIYVITYEDAVANMQEFTPNRRAKISGLLKKFKSYSFLCALDAYLDLLEQIGPTSLVFEAESLMPYEVSLAVSRSVMQLNEKQDEIRTEDEFLDTFVARFVIQENGLAKGEFPKAGDKRKKRSNREYISVEFDLDDFDRERCLQKVHQIKSNVIPVLVETLKTRFSNYDDAIYSKTRWLNPEMWCADKEYGIEDITSIASHFARPLELASFNLTSALKEWRSFKIFVKSHYPKLPDPKSLWKSVLSIRPEEFPNLCKLASLAICISGSNSTVERTFSVLTNILSDKCLSMRHSTLDDSLVVYGNDGLWSAKEKEEIIDRAVQIYLKTSKRRKKVGQPAKKQKLDEVAEELVDPLIHVTDDSDHSNTDSDLCFSDELSGSDTDSD